MSYTPSQNEHCCKCGDRFGDTGAYYCGRIRVCQRCWQDETEAGQLMQDSIEFDKLIRRATWWALGLAAFGWAVVASVVKLFI